MIADRWPDRDAANLAYAMYLLPTVQITPRGLWGRSARPAVTTLEHWLGADGLGPAAGPAELVRRYLAVFGPATPADFSNWSGIAGIRDTFEELGPKLRTFRDPSGRELFDLPRAPRPDPATPAPVRFLPEYDNVVLGHADRSRVVPPGVPQWTAVGWGTVLVDGFVTARWHDTADGIVVEPFRDLSRTERRAVDVGGSAAGRIPRRAAARLDRADRPIPAEPAPRSPAGPHMTTSCPPADELLPDGGLHRWRTNRTEGSRWREWW